MNKSLKIIERMIEAVYAEIKIASQDDTLSEKSYALMNQAMIDAINLRVKVEAARAWNTHNK